MDEEIEQRLRGLDETVDELVRKHRSKELQKEIELRLARLNERDPNFYSSQEPPVKLLSIKKHRTTVEEADHLLKQFMEEITLDDKSVLRRESSTVVDQQLEERLEKLATAQAELNLNRKNPKLKKFKQTGELIHQLRMKSFEIQERNENGNQDDDVDQVGQHEFDWCSTCNEDGVLRCIDCDMDIFCLECFRELHRDRDVRGHRTQPYTTKSSSSKPIHHRE